MNTHQRNEQKAFRDIEARNESFLLLFGIVLILCLLALL